jgi:hypothetical protein
VVCHRHVIGTGADRRFRLASLVAVANQAKLREAVGRQVWPGRLESQATALHCHCTAGAAFTFASPACAPTPSTYRSAERRSLPLFQPSTFTTRCVTGDKHFRVTATSSSAITSSSLQVHNLFRSSNKVSSVGTVPSPTFQRPGFDSDRSPTSLDIEPLYPLDICLQPTPQPQQWL